MAFVILSAGSLATSRSRTLSMRAVMVMLSLATVAILAAGAAIGYVLSRGSSTIVVQTHPQLNTPAYTSDSRLLIDRIGELTGRMSQLENEARDLAFRVGVLAEIDGRANMAESAEGRLAKTPPGKPAGGPLLKPVQNESGVVDPSLENRVEDTLGLGTVEGSMERLSELMRELDQAVVALNLAHMALPGREPVRDRPVVSSFGNRVDPFTRKRAFHSGVDYPAPTGTPIYASAGGRVIFSGYRAQYGRTVEIDHGGELVTRYAHASALLVKVGQVVMPGEQIARVGSTGRSSGPHLHFEILRDGRFVDPTTYMAQFRGL